MKRKIKDIYIYIRKQEKFRIQKLSSHLKKTRKDAHSKAKVISRKEILNIKSE